MTNRARVLNLTKPTHMWSSTSSNSHLEMFYQNDILASVLACACFYSLWVWFCVHINLCHSHAFLKVSILTNSAWAQCFIWRMKCFFTVQNPELVSASKSRFLYFWQCIWSRSHENQGCVAWGMKDCWIIEICDLSKSPQEWERMQVKHKTLKKKNCPLVKPRAS